MLFSFFFFFFFLGEIVSKCESFLVYEDTHNYHHALSSLLRLTLVHKRSKKKRRTKNSFSRHVVGKVLTLALPCRSFSLHQTRANTTATNNKKVRVKSEWFFKKI